MEQRLSKVIAGILGPTLAIIVAAEFPLVQPCLYTQQTPPVIYLSGVLLFVAGLAILRNHNIWVRNWSVLVTLSGWGMLILGLTRVFSATHYHQAAVATPSWVFMAIEAVLFIVGLFLTFKAYIPAKSSTAAGRA